MIRHDQGKDRFDQANQLRCLMGEGDSRRVSSRRSTHVIAVVSGKGGVGKTLISSNLSIGLAARGHRVILFDMDMGLANADLMLGIESAYTWSEVLGGRRSLDEVIVQAPGEIAFVAGSSGSANLANLSEFERHQLLSAMQRVEEHYDIMVLDCGAGISHNVLGLANSADTILVVAVPEPPAIADAYAMVKAFAQEQYRGNAGPSAGASVGVVVNQANSRREGGDTYERLASVAARFLHVPVTDYGYILRDEHVPAAVRQRHPVLLSYPRCSASSCLMALAGRVSRELGTPEQNQGLFYRVMSMFL